METERNDLLARLDHFLDGLAGDPDPAAFSPRARIVENNAPVVVGEGLWKDATAIGGYRIAAADAETAQAGFIGLIWRGEEASICGIRLAFRDGLIDEVEIIRGPGRFPGAKGVDARTLGAARPCFAATIAAGDRMSRADLIGTAAGYYAAVNRSEPDLARLDPSGARIEAGTQITGNPDFAFEFYEREDGGALPNFGLWSAREQFRRGLWNADGVTDERYPLADRATGVVFAFTVYRPWHKRGWTDVDGVGRVTPLKRETRRVGLNMLEAFKIENGVIMEMESVWTIEPASFQSIWAGRQDRFHPSTAS